MPVKTSSNLTATTFKLTGHTRQLIRELSEKYGSQGNVITVAVELLAREPYRKANKPSSNKSLKHLYTEMCEKSGQE